MGKNKKNLSPFPTKDHDTVSDTVLQAVVIHALPPTAF